MKRFAALVVLYFVSLHPYQAVAQEAVELELLLAIDCSGSIDDAEYALQMKGLAWALSHPQVLALIGDGANRKIAIAVMQWSGGLQQEVVIDWTAVESTKGALALADRVAATPRRFHAGDTAIGGALNFAARLFDGNGFEGLRRVIDLSGDGGAGRGQTTAATTTEAARNRTLARGITINGLAILNEDPQLDEFYREHLIGGAGAFVMTASDYNDLAETFLAKLIREIGSTPLAQGMPSGEAKAAELARADPDRMESAGDAIRSARWKRGVLPSDRDPL